MIINIQVRRPHSPRVYAYTNSYHYDAKAVGAMLHNGNSGDKSARNTESTNEGPVPRMDPCRTPENTGNEFETSPFITTLCCLL